MIPTSDNISKIYTNNDHIDHEIRIRILENLEVKMNERFNKLEQKMDSQFYWMVGMIITSFGGIMLHMANLL